MAKWTAEQQKVIDSRDRSLLVAAAAGSGKTAVLVEHILEMITDPTDPVSVTDLLVVTFTRAAAAEMKERLRAKLTQRGEEEPGNPEIGRQITLLDQAHISTIDSFCQWMVKNYFYRLDLDPDFRIPDEGEGKLIREEILDGFYEEGNEDYFRLIDSFGGGKGDRTVRERIESLTAFAESMPWPARWLRGQLKNLEKETGNVEETAGAEAFEEKLRETLEEYQLILSEAAVFCQDEPGLDRYAGMFLQDARQVGDCLGSKGLTELLQALGSVKFSRKPVIPKKQRVDEEKREEMSALRDLVKKGVTQLGRRFSLPEPDRASEWMRASSADRAALLRLALAFLEAYGREKRARNLADFADIEHWALDLLAEPDGNGSTPTPLAAELGDQFREILVDEYQDSNLVQETILRTLSGEDRGHPNFFMVGDVKQSIYKFRMAKPELFMEKYRRFSCDPLPSGQKIDLNRNFRSRPEILREVNGVFSQIMGEKLGGIEYDASASLHAGAVYPGEDEPVELLLAEGGDLPKEPVEWETRLIAEKIRELVDEEHGMKVLDEDGQTLRPARYRDIAILLRTMEGWSDSMASILNQAGIPAYAESKKGYFSAPEVQILLNFLRILDNPLQDIPLVSVLLSPIGGFSEEELAFMAAGTGEEQDFWVRCRQAAAEGRSSRKWRDFAEKIERYRREAQIRPIDEILEKILEETDLGLIFAAEPGGAVRAANVEMLLERARAFEQTSYHGIFHFIRYMERLQQYQVDYGEAAVLSENENLVRITSIHKSKGLEYPIVFVAGLGKKFNFMDVKKPILIHDELGLACDAVDLEQRISHPTLWKRVVADRMESDIRGEELRILYVAMTRAKEKLILTGTCPESLESLEKRWALASAAGGRGRKLPAFLVGEAQSFLDWIVMARRADPSCLEQTRLFPAADLTVRENVSLQDREERRKEWQAVAAGDVQDPAFSESFRALCTYRYPGQAVCCEKAAWSVSERAKDTGEGPEREAGERVPARPGSLSGAARGTAYHTVLGRIAPDLGADAAAVAEALTRMTEDGILTGEEAAAVDPQAIADFFASPLGKRMTEAAREGRLRREQPFIRKVSLREMLPPPRRDSVPADEWVLEQGIIDAFWEDEDGMVLWDYKTDAVSRRGGEERLLSLYQEQLFEYKEALEQARGKPVKEMWIYSFALKKAVWVPEKEA